MMIVTCGTGCGTMANLDGRRYALISLPNVREPQVYGGVQNDFRWGGPFLLDVPLSAVTDTLTIPFVLDKQKRFVRSKAIEPDNLETTDSSS